ncbi:MAG: glycosyltransferase family 2 protein [Candidatus Omnitrophota bacterium]|nr:glycosyltransferase family 2 protein [Candidatus Omnitrophota bacterium]
MEGIAENLSIVIPVFNEDVHIDNLLNELFQLFAEGKVPEIIVVDDGSTDNTPDLVDKFDVRTVRHERRRGYGASLKSGVRQAKSKYICIIDADNTYSVSDILSLTAEVDVCDMVVGDRRDDVKRPKDHLLAKKSMEKILSRVFEVPVADLNSGLRIMKRCVLLKYLDLLPDGFSLTSSITLIMLLKRYRIKYIPIKYERRDKGTKIRRLAFVAAFLYGYLRVLSRYFTGKL